MPWGVSAARSRAGTLLATVAAALALLLGPGVSPAAAGGDTSVLLVAVRSSEATALLAADERYAQLLGLLPQSPGRGRERPLSDEEWEGARQITATWMAHDVSPWRVDRVHVLPADRGGDAPDVWIETGWDGSLAHARWQRAVYPAELLAALKSLGLLGRAGADTTTGPATAGEGVRTAPVAATGPGPARPWWWAGAGVAVGAPSALLLRSFAGRLRTSTATGAAAGARGAREPRQELRDL
ncbi:hypothetical protein ACFWIA_00300 [Streptomyces sp. NPDC127068]|uniref:hypothetical protein n=1 Tax=Streptomyces sp. NPDC127068 TaxID=3347127 RepID=UPI0036599777